KIGHPEQPELGLGAIAEGGQPVFDDDMLERVGLRACDLADVIARERDELARRGLVYRGGGPRAGLAGRRGVRVGGGRGGRGGGRGWGGGGPRAGGEGWGGGGWRPRGGGGRKKKNPRGWCLGPPPAGSVAWESGTPNSVS